MSTVDFDWEMGVFKALRGLWRRFGPKESLAAGPAAARWSEEADRWRHLASLLAGRPVRLLSARDQGGIRGDDLLLPAAIEIGPDPELNRALLLARLVVDATTLGRRPASTADPETEARRSVDQLGQELPRFTEAWAEALALVAPLPSPPALWGRLIPVEGVEAANPTDPGAPPDREATEADARPVEEIKVLTLNPEDEKQMPLHSFEKVEQAEAFNGTVRQLDGEDELDDHLESLEEVDLGALLRGGPEAHSVLRADVALDADIPDLGRVRPTAGGLPYDEWDGAARAWRKGWCHVYPTRMGLGDPTWAAEARSRHQALIERLTSALLAHRQQRQERRRQSDGEDVDIDALVDAMAQLRAGRDPDPRLYIRQPAQRRDLATTVLLDISLSTDAWVENQRVLDVAREAVLVLGTVAERLGDRLQVLAFGSHTRAEVRVWTVRDWEEPWAVAEGRLGALRPQGYTRIGAAIRHATVGLAKLPARDRLLLLVSDGKPTDYDRYEGRYGIADVRMALRQARDQGVRVHALAVDAVARDTLPAMMGPSGWDILPHPDRLVEALTRAYGQMS